MIHRSRGPGRISRKGEEMRGWKERFAWHGKERPCFTQQLVGRSSRHLQKSIPRRWRREGSRPKAEGSAWGNGPSLRAEHRAIVRAPKPGRKETLAKYRNIRKRKPKLAPSLSEAIHISGREPTQSGRRRGEERGVGGRERVARKMTINNWYNAARPSFRRRRRAPLPLPVCLSVCLSVRRSHCYCKESGGRANGGRESEGKRARSSSAERQMRSPLAGRPLRHHHIVSLHALMASGLKMNPLPPTRCCLRRDRTEVA